MQVDEYAKQFMEGEGAALYFDKRVASPATRWLMTGSVVAAAVAIGVTAVDDPGALWGLGLLGIAGLATVTFWSLRTLVTPKFIHIQYGIGGKKIPVDDVVSVDVIDYNWIRFGGWGIRRDLSTGAIAYNMRGDQGRAAKIVYKKGARTQTLFVSADNPERLRDAIRSAMAGTTVATVAAGDDALADARATLGLNDAHAGDVAGAKTVEANVEVEVAQR